MTTTRYLPEPVAPRPHLAVRILVPLVLFTLHVGTSFLITAVHCDRGQLVTGVLGTSAARALLYGITLASLAVAISLAATGFVEWWRLERGEAHAGDVNGRVTFGLFLAAGAAASLSLYLVWSLIAIGTVETC